MSRELKFRAWVNDHWVDWIPTCKTLGAYNANIIDTDGYTFEEDNPFIVEQYTGLKDKNGKEIYEGDIVDYAGECTCVIQYEDEGARFIHRDISDDFPFGSNGLGEYNGNLFEVIGNIHENPELLEGK